MTRSLAAKPATLTVTQDDEPEYKLAMMPGDIVRVAIPGEVATGQRVFEVELAMAEDATRRARDEAGKERAVLRRIAYADSFDAVQLILLDRFGLDTDR